MLEHFNLNNRTSIFILQYLSILINFELSLVVYTNFSFENFSNTDSLWNPPSKTYNWNASFLPSRYCFLCILLHSLISDLNKLLIIKLCFIFCCNACEFAKLLFFRLFLVLSVLFFLLSCLLCLFAELRLLLRWILYFIRHNF